MLFRIGRIVRHQSPDAILIVVYGLIGSRSQVVRQYRRLQAVLARHGAELILHGQEPSLIILLMASVTFWHRAVSPFFRPTP